MPTTALATFEKTHGKNCEFLSKSAIIELMEVFARSFYNQKLLEANFINESYFEEKRQPPKPTPPPITEQP